MATLNATNALTLIELAKRQDPNGDLADIAEVLTEENPILLDAPWEEANGGTFHQVTRRASLAYGSWRRLNAGVEISSTQTINQIEQIGMLEDFAYTDEDWANKQPNPEQARNDEAMGHIEGMAQTLATTMFYGNNGVEPEKFDGLAVRMDTLTANHVIGAGGTGADTTSIFLVQWKGNGVRHGCHMVYPRGNANMGVNHDDLGLDRVLDGSDNPYMAYVDHFKVHAGLVVRDDRCIKRVANIESTGASNLFDADDVITLLNQFRYGGRNVRMYVNRTVKTQMDIQAKDKANVNYTTTNVFGVPTMAFQGVPVLVCDAITNTETAIS